MTGRLWVAAAAAALLALGASLPALWWEPLHVDEVVTLTVPRLGLAEIVDTVFAERGGAPVHFLLEHWTLEWPGGLEGLRVPSLVFLLLALPTSLLLGRELAGEWEAIAGAVLLALAPLAVGLATFGRMYTLFLAAVLWAAWLALRAARGQGLLPWLIAGATAGLLVYVHPVAPPYVVLVLLTGVLLSEAAFPGVAARAGMAIAAAGLVGLPYYLVPLDRLRDRYGVHLDRPRLDTTAGRSVPEESIHALTPGETPGAVLFGVVALVGVVWLVRKRPRSGVAVALWIVLPVAFFSLVPAGDTRFFDRYLVPVLPFFLLAVAAGCLVPWRLAPKAAALAAALVLGAGGWQAWEDAGRLRGLRDLGIRSLLSSVEPYEEEGVLFPSAGRLRAGRPATLLDEYLRLELDGLDPGRREGVGLWVFAGSPETVQRFRPPGGAALRLARPSETVLLVVSAEESDDLERQDALVRAAWETAAANRRG